MTPLHYVILYFVIGFGVAFFELVMQVREMGDKYQTKYAPLAFVTIFWPIWAIMFVLDFLEFLSPLRRIDKALIYLFKKREP